MGPIRSYGIALLRDNVIAMTISPAPRSRPGPGAGPERSGSCCGHTPGKCSLMGGCSLRKSRIRSRSMSATNGFGKNCQPLFSTNIPVARPEISSISVSGLSWFNWMASSIPVIPGISISDNSRWIVPSNSRAFSSASFSKRRFRLLLRLLLQWLQDEGLGCTDYADFSG